MRPRTTAASLLIAMAAVGPLAGTAHARDLDCRHFTHQEEAQAVLGSDPGDADRLDANRGPDDGRACETLPRSGAGATISATSRPPRPTASPTRTAPPSARPTAPTPPTTLPPRPRVSVTPPPTRGVRGGLGGTSTTGPSGWDIGIGLTCVTSASFAACWAIRRHRRA